MTTMAGIGHSLATLGDTCPGLPVKCPWAVMPKTVRVEATGYALAYMAALGPPMGGMGGRWVSGSMVRKNAIDAKV